MYASLPCTNSNTLCISRSTGLVPPPSSPSSQHLPSSQPTGTITLSELSGPLPPPQPPAVGETVTAKVVHVVSLTHFYIQRPHPWLLLRLSQIKEVKLRNGHDVEPGAACLARFHGDEAYHRVIVLSVSGCEVKVCYVDFGNCLVLHLDDLFPLPSEFCDVPALAIPCALVGGDLLMPMGGASATMLQMFSELIVDRNLSVTIKVGTCPSLSVTSHHPVPLRFTWSH